MSTRDAVLDALREAGAGGVSGEVLARRLRISRVAVGKHVAALRDAGYTIEARAGEGYRFVSAPDLPLPTEVARLLTHPMWTRVEGAEETGSTNDDAKALARSGADEGTVVVASRQRSGRGRLGRSWDSPVGGVYLSAVLRPPVAPVDASPLALVVSVGVAHGLERLGAQPALKWPNDVLLGGSKVAGVLLEMTAEVDRVEWVVAGVGLNVHGGGSRQPDAAYLEDSIAGIRTPEAAAAVLDGIGEAYSAWRTSGFGALRGEYESRDSLVGASVTVSVVSGSVVAAGTAAGIDAMGRLLVRSDTGTVAVSAGDVTLRRSTD
jgi:BirA family biotin operon repressor/biotin-[acetyl-CoA-carboxylase] ligase